MATQDFLSGGFYGKLGDVVGQRWHNKRYVRTWVKGTNPNTPAQQDNRGMFAKATKLAQIAFNINKGDTSWDTTAKGEFSIRVGTAMKRLKAGMSDTDALPLYPDGFSPSHTLSGPSYSYNSAFEEHTVSCSDTFDVQNRTFGIVIHCYNAFTMQWEDIEYTHHNTDTTFFSFMWPKDDVHAYPAGSTFTATTSDDASHSNFSVLLPSFSFVQIVKPSLNTVITWGTFTGDANWVSFNPSLSIPISGTFEEISGDIYIYSLFNDQWENQTFNISFQANGSASSGIELATENQARPGTQIYDGEAEIDRGIATIWVSWSAKAFTWP
jgi:hypothetical protein